VLFLWLNIAWILCCVVHCADHGLLYMCGDGLHGKLALGDDNIANHFKPALISRFGKFIVESVKYLWLVIATCSVWFFFSSLQWNIQLNWHYKAPLYMARFHVVVVIHWSLHGQDLNQTPDLRTEMACLNLPRNRLVLRSCLSLVRWFGVVNCPTASTCLAVYRPAYDDDKRCR